MRRKQISFEALERLEESSLNRVGDELKLVAPLLSEALSIPALRLRNFGVNSVMFESIDGTYVSGTYNYDADSGQITVDNLEIVVLNEETENQAAGDFIRGFLESIQSNNLEKADDFINDYLRLPRIRKIHKSEAKPLSESIRDSKWAPRRRQQEFVLGAMRESLANKTVGWRAIAEAAISSIDQETMSPSLRTAKIKKDDHGNIVKVCVGDKKTRNESILAHSNKRAIGREILEGWATADRLLENRKFVDDILTLKRANFNSNDNDLEDAISNISVQYPELLYVTESHLSDMIKTALESSGVERFSDEDCEFMAEAILHTIHSVHKGRVERVLYAANESRDDSGYESFKSIVDDFYPHIAEHAAEEIRLYADLYESIREVHEAASKCGNRVLVAKSASHLDSLIPVINFEASSDHRIAEAAAEFLHVVAESNAPKSEEDNLRSLNPPSGNVGMNPPRDGLGTAAAIDTDTGKTKKLGADRGMGTEDKESYPKIMNPYLPKSLQPAIGKDLNPTLNKKQGEAEFSDEGGSDLYPSLKNPYLQKSLQLKVKDSPEDGGLANIK